MGIERTSKKASVEQEVQEGEEESADDADMDADMRAGAGTGARVGAGAEGSPPAAYSVDAAKPAAGTTTGAASPSQQQVHALEEEGRGTHPTTANDHLVQPSPADDHLPPWKDSSRENKNEICLRALKVLHEIIQGDEMILAGLKKAPLGRVASLMVGLTR